MASRQKYRPTEGGKHPDVINYDNPAFTSDIGYHPDCPSPNIVKSYRALDDGSAAEEAYTWRKRFRTACCIIGLSTLVILAGAGVGVWLGLFYDPGTETQTKSPVVMEIVKNDIHGSATLKNRKWSNDYKDPNSNTYKRMATEFIRKMDTEFRRSVMAEEYDGTVVTGFSNRGSLKILFQITMKTTITHVTGVSTTIYPSGSSTGSGIKMSDVMKVVKKHPMLRDPKISKINECKPSPCRNGGRCIDNIGSFTCQCASGYRGQTCAEEIDPCQPNPCRNNGICISNMGYHTCRCVKGFEGIDCGIAPSTTVRPPSSTTVLSVFTTVSSTHDVEFSCVDDERVYMLVMGSNNLTYLSTLDNNSSRYYKVVANAIKTLFYDHFRPDVAAISNSVRVCGFQLLDFDEWNTRKKRGTGTSLGPLKISGSLVLAVRSQTSDMYVKSVVAEALQQSTFTMNLHVEILQIERF